MSGEIRVIEGGETYVNCIDRWGYAVDRVEIVSGRRIAVMIPSEEKRGTVAWYNKPDLYRFERAVKLRKWQGLTWRSTVMATVFEVLWIGPIVAVVVLALIALAVSLSHGADRPTKDDVCIVCPIDED